MRDVQAAERPLGSADAPEAIHLSEYLAVIVKRRVVMYAAVAVALLWALLVSLLSRPMYRATVVIDVEQEKGSPLDIGNAMPIVDSYNPEFIPTQTRLMRSRETAERVVQRLNLMQNALIKPPSSGLFRRGGDVSKTASKGSGIEPATLLAMQILGGIGVAPIRGTNLVELSYTAPTAKLASEIANALADAYIDWNLELKYRIVGQASQFLTRQVEQLKGEVEEKERQLQAYGRQKDIISMNPQSNITLQKLDALNKDYSAAVGERVSKEAKYHEVETSRPDAIADMLSNALVTQMRNEQARLERDYAEKLNLFKPEWPAMEQLRAQIQKGKQHLNSVIEETVTKARETARAEYQTALRREESLKKVLGTQKAEAMALNSNAIEYNNLQVEVVTKRTLMDTLLKRQSETEVTSHLRGSRESNIRVVDRAIPPSSRYSPSYRKNLALAVFLGVAFGVGLVFLLEYLDRSIRTMEVVESYLHLPALGIIPAVSSEIGGTYGYGYGYGYIYGSKRRKAAQKAGETGPEKPKEAIAIDLLPYEHPRSSVAEAYRALRAALLVSHPGGVRSVVVTSANSGEGKTATSINLAVVMAQLGKKVLLIDADLHKARIHEALKISNLVGLVSILAENFDLTRAILPCSVPNLYVIPAGPHSPNPSSLLASEAMEKLLKLVLMKFDCVILDSPPVQLVADALVLGAQVDGVMLTVRAGKTPREQVAKARDKLQRAQVRILGVLLNRLEERDDRYGHSYYSDGERYLSDRNRATEQPVEKVVSGSGTTHAPADA
jgi:capsular exopolysaccharide synthesis family protein